MREEADDADCQSSSPASGLGLLSEKKKESALTLLYVSSVQVGALNGSCIAYKLVS